MQLNLRDKKILLGVTGSISAYKACEIVRLFIKSGADIRVIMTPSAERFISPLTFEALTRNPVLTENTESWSSALNHIDIGKWCDLFVIAPATANTINKLSQGIADNILLQTALACTKPLLIAPAANTNMIKHQATTNSLDTLKRGGIHIISSQSKLLACGDYGNGALAEPLEIFYQAAQKLIQETFWIDRHVVVTGGGTREKIDDVRYLSNFSSGKMANAIATALYLKGAKVFLITTKEHTDIPKSILVKDVESTQEMLEATNYSINLAKKANDKIPFLFMVAAVSDFAPKSPYRGKIKKSDKNQEWSIKLKQNPDILAQINKDNIKTVGFKAEMDASRGFENAKSLIAKKGVDAVCYNLLKNSDSFGTNKNRISFITQNNSIDLGEADKLTLAFKILDESQTLINE